MFDESKVTRVPKGSPEGGQFTSHDGNDGTHKATPAEERRLREMGVEPQLDRREYAILRAEVIRKNAAQKGKVKSTNFAFTADYFYVYTTDGYDGFSSFVQLDIEIDGEKIDEYLSLFKE